MGDVKRESALEYALAILATAIGAGFASGRETVVFFSRFGSYSWLGIAITSAIFGGLIAGLMRLCAHFKSGAFSELAARALGRVGGTICSAMYAVMLLITAGAMASGISEVASVTLAVPFAREIGLALGVAVCAVCAARGVKALAAGGSFLLPICALLYISIARHAPHSSAIASAPPADARLSIPFAIGYACLNVTLCCGVLSEIGARVNCGQRKRIALYFVPLISALLGASNAAILPHAARLFNEPLPIIQLSRGSTAAALLAIAALLLAMATTLTALLRSISRMMPARFPGWLSLTLCAAGAAACGAIGFNSIIGMAYPIMGWAGALALLAILIVGGRKARIQTGKSNIKSNNK
ncbi:MAG: hypothetical protein LBS72_08645 [Oscillospiraceae bacterium]|jgi:uncharacterized membrane protein YkvI|nr:hypothetical protein [Oscillospiraceae bacterium]